MTKGSEEDKKKEQKLKEIRTLLASGKEEDILKGIQEVRKNGDPKIIPDLVETWTQGHGPKIQDEITGIFFDLKQTQALEPLIEALDHPKMEDRTTLLSVFWNSRLDPTPYLEKFVDIAVQGNYMECFECLTVIEEMEGPFQENNVMEGLLKTQTYLSGNTDEKKEMIEAIRDRLKAIEDKL